jgi:lipid-A-disaccharide synthase
VTRLLVVAGEASGDRAAAAVVSVLRRARSVSVVGMGGAALEAAGASLMCDLRDTTAMGLGAVAARARAIVTSGARLLHAAAREPFDAALLVNYSDFNARLAPLLHRRGVHVVWYGAPQVWAWRSGRMDTLRPHVDRMAVMLPFEEPLWRARGVDAHYVGHPARETVMLGRNEARRALALTDLASTIAILPGSRPHEVDALLEPMLDAADRVRRDRASIDTRVLLASSLDRATRSRARETAAKYRIATFDVSASQGAGAVLPAFDVALTASGTASLEAALARAVPVVAYRVGLVTEAVARLLVRTPYYALPNVLLQRRAFPELVQRDVNAATLATAVARALDARAELLEACDEVERILGDPKTPSREVAAMLLPWLGAPDSSPR